MDEARAAETSIESNEERERRVVEEIRILNQARDAEVPVIAAKLGSGAMTLFEAISDNGLPPAA